MAQLSQLEESQKQIQQSLWERMDYFEDKLKAATSASKCQSIENLDTEFQLFKQIVSSAFESLHQQIKQLHHSIDSIEAHHRRKALIISGIPEDDKENTSSIFNILKHKMNLQNIETESVTQCHRLGKSKGRSRPILVCFKSHDIKTLIWRNKTQLKGSNISLSEFLTKPRQALYANIRKHFGMRSCWTHDGMIYVKLPNGERCKVSTLHELNTVIAQFPHVSGATNTASSQETACPVPASATTKRTIEMRSRTRSKKP